MGLPPSFTTSLVPRWTRRTLMLSSLSSSQLGRAPGLQKSTVLFVNGLKIYISRLGAFPTWSRRPGDQQEPARRSSSCHTLLSLLESLRPLSVKVVDTQHGTAQSREPCTHQTYIKPSRRPYLQDADVGSKVCTVRYGTTTFEMIGFGSLQIQSVRRASPMQLGSHGVFFATTIASTLLSA